MNHHRIKFATLSIILLLASACAHSGGRSNSTQKKSAGGGSPEVIPAQVNKLNSSESMPTKLSPQQANILCHRITGMKMMPLKGDRGVDSVFDAFMDAGDAVVPCLIDRVTDSTKIPNISGAPGYADVQFRIGDAAFFLVLFIKDRTPDQFLPSAEKEKYKDVGEYAYYEYVKESVHRKEVQERLRQSFLESGPRLQS